MRALKIVGLLVAAAVLIFAALVVFQVAPRIIINEPILPIPIVTSFEECAAAGNPVMESYPRQCRSLEGKLFVEEIEQGNPDTTLNSDERVGGGCAIAGCSGQLCVSGGEAANMVTTCEFRAQYACYQSATCEPQANGLCGWTETPTLTQCLANPPEFEGELQVM